MARSPAEIQADIALTRRVIEHQLDVIASADWIVDMGPEGGDEGVGARAPGDTGLGEARRERVFTSQLLEGMVSAVAAIKRSISGISRPRRRKPARVRAKVLGAGLVARDRDAVAAHPRGATDAVDVVGRHHRQLEGARQRRDPGGADRDHHPPGVLFRLGECDVGGCGRKECLFRAEYRERPASRGVTIASAD